MAGALDLRGTVTMTDRATAPLRRVQGQIARISRRSGLKALATQGRAVSLALGNAARAATRLAAPLAGLAGLAGAGGLAAVGLAVKKFADHTDELAKFSRQVGFTVQSMREVKFIADRQGVSQSLLATSLIAMNKRIGELKAGTGGLKTLLDKTNPALAEQLKTVESSEAAFGLLMGALGALPNVADKSALAAAAFSRSGVAMTRVAELGADGFVRMRKEARGFLGILGAGAAGNVEAFKDRMADLGAAMAGLRDAIGKRLLPILTPLVAKLSQWIAANRELIASKVSGAVLALADALKTVDWAGTFAQAKAMFSAIGDLAAKVGGFKTILAGLGTLMAGPLIVALAGVVKALVLLGATLAATPVGAVALAIGAAAAAIILNWDKIKPVIEGLKETFATFVRWFKSNVFDPIVNLISRIRSTISSIGSAVRGLFGGGKVKGGDGSVFGTAPAGKAIGGMARAGHLYGVNEHGQELFAPGADGRVLSSGLLARALRAGAAPGGGGQTRAELDINIKGAPPGTSVRYAEKGHKLFERPRFHTGRVMAPAGVQI